MTSPSWPVIWISPFPGITAASTYMRSPSSGPRQARDAGGYPSLLQVVARALVPRGAQNLRDQSRRDHGDAVRAGDQREGLGGGVHGSEGSVGGRRSEPRGLVLVLVLVLEGGGFPGGKDGGGADLDLRGVEAAGMPGRRPRGCTLGRRARWRPRGFWLRRSALAPARRRVLRGRAARACVCAMRRFSSAMYHGTSIVSMRRRGRSPPEMVRASFAVAAANAPCSAGRTGRRGRRRTGGSVPGPGPRASPPRGRRESAPIVTSSGEITGPSPRPR